MHLKTIGKQSEFRVEGLKNFTLVADLDKLNEAISEFERVIAMCTHHDIITGTCFFFFFKD